MMRKTLAAATLFALTAATTPVVAAEDGSYGADAGVGIGAVFVNLLYMPAKFVYAGLGGLTGGFAYLLTGLNYEVADKIWAPSLGGDYVVTTKHLRNQETLYFSGVVPADEPAPVAAPQTSEGWAP